MVGFILMLDAFKEENGATGFVPGSQNWPDVPSNRLANPRLKWDGEILACGDAGSMIIFNAAVWHGHTANATSRARRSIQGYFVRRGADQAADFPMRRPDGQKQRGVCFSHRKPVPTGFQSQLDCYQCASPRYKPVVTPA
jgi:ectoine hydroxylase-related dioxygenase (phytanoyl-CoA dioxygenase family)